MSQVWFELFEAAKTGTMRKSWFDDLLAEHKDNLPDADKSDLCVVLTWPQSDHFFERVKAWDK